MSVNIYSILLSMGQSISSTLEDDINDNDDPSFEKEDIAPH